MKALVFAGFFAVTVTGTYVAWAQDAPKTVAAPAAPDLGAQLNACTKQNATVVQLWRDISNQRGQYEVQMASIRTILGPACPETEPVSACVEKLVAKPALEPKK